MNEEVTTIESVSVSSESIDSDSQADVTSEYNPPEVVTTFDIEVVTTPSNYEMYQSLHQDLYNIQGLLSILVVMFVLYGVIRYINKIYHYLFH